MKITVTWGTGVGSTKLSAFDKALWNAGIANLNLIPLSSVIPPNSVIKIKKLSSTNSEINFGKRVYVVLSCKSTGKIGKNDHFPVFDLFGQIADNFFFLNSGKHGILYELRIKYEYTNSIK